MTNYKYDECCSGNYPHPCPHPRLNQTILSCGTGSGLIIPEHSEGNSQLFNPYSIASVAIDASELKSANVKVDFSCIILFREDARDDLRLTFQLSKNYVNGGKIALGSWNFERDFDDDDQIETIDSFGFTWCECDTCPGCAYYTVELINIESEGVDSAAISNSSINALAVGPLAYY
ncbi:MAG TPA: DUF4489 domain-containing protein [Syntrophomonadaceae bacterium]|nr:DUF4489 domain-containing protein [Syntrophomonadaceae bacterium]